MQFHSWVFVAFLAVVCAIHYLLPGKARYVWLLLCSIAFYVTAADALWKNLVSLGLMVAVTLISYGCALGAGGSGSLRARRWLMAFSILVSVGSLLFLKYANFFISGAEALSEWFGGSGGFIRLNLLVPLGISYYTLQSISYVVDVYTGVLPAERNLVRYALYIAFFPSIMVGPINRAPDMLPQYKNPPTFDYNRVSGGLFRVVWGIFKKMVIADNLARFTMPILSTPGAYPGPVLILAALLFTYQLYTDFGGVCDIAIGAARMMGFTFMENFKRPFAAKTFAALWQRWHISLTSFFRDYVFTPLVWSRWTQKLPLIGKKMKKPPTESSVIIIFIISGLWHGPHIGFVLWGLLNGLLLGFAKRISKPKEKLIAHIPLYRNTHVRGFFQRIFVYLLFSVCLLFFITATYNSGIVALFSGFASGWATFSLSLLEKIARAAGLKTAHLIAVAASILAVEGIERGGNVADWIRARRWPLRWLLYYGLLLLLLFFGSFGQSRFIYQNF